METANNEICSALLEIIKQESSPEAVEARNMMLRRIATAGDVTPSRIPAPLNITEIGGYINLLESIRQDDMRNRMLASILGVAMPFNVNELRGTGPELFFAKHLSDRPECEQTDTFPLAFYMRCDFLEAFRTALDTIHSAGAMLPVYQPFAPKLSSYSSKIPSQDDIQALLGRRLELAPTAAFVNPEQDPLIVAKNEEDITVYARAEGAADINESAVEAYVRQGDGYTTMEINAKLISIAPIMEAVGWYMEKGAEGQDRAEDPSIALRWINITGLVPGRTSLASELYLLHAPAQVIGSTLRDMLYTVWDGEKFS